jgi:hypothetical protein
MNLFDVVPAVVAMTIPLVAIIGGITAGIIRSNAKQRLIELAQRERIAAIERGIDPDRLPALHLPVTDLQLTFEQRQLRRSQSLRIWGLALLGFGAALWFGIGLSEGDLREGAPAVMFAGLGIALLIGGHMVRPDPEDLRRGAPRPPTAGA